MDYNLTTPTYFLLKQKKQSERDFVATALVTFPSPAHPPRFVFPVASDKQPHRLKLFHLSNM